MCLAQEPQHSDASDDVGFATVYHRYTVANLICYPIRCHVAFTSALELGFTVHKVLKKMKSKTKH